MLHLALDVLHVTWFIEPATILTIAVALSAWGSGNSTKRRFETGPNSVNCKARIVQPSTGFETA
jgi:hypothetical protein